MPIEISTAFSTNDEHQEVTVLTVTDPDSLQATAIRLDRFMKVEDFEGRLKKLLEQTQQLWK